MRTVSVTKHLTAASGNCIALAQTVVAAGNVVLNGGSVTTKPLGAIGADITVAALDTQRRVAIISDGDDHLVTAHIYGFRQGGQAINETLTLANAGTVVSALDYLNISTIAVSAAIANHITIGTNGTGSTDWVMPNFEMTPFSVRDVQQITGSVGWNLEVTGDIGWWDTPPGQATTPPPNIQTVVTGATIPIVTVLSEAVTGYRHTVISGTGTLAAQSTQAGLSNF